MKLIRLFGLGCLLLLGSCDGPVQQVTPYMDDNPQLLSAWGVMKVRSKKLVLSAGVVPYDLNTPLFTDFAHKYRTIWLPEGTSAIYRTGQALDFPVGTIITKTFYYPRGGTGLPLKTDSYAYDFKGEFLGLSGVQLIETRLLIHREEGWAALPYIWNEAQTDAVLERTGGSRPMRLQLEGGGFQEFTYVVPNANQCAGCHATNATTKAIAPIGPAPRHLNKDYDYPQGEENQLVHLSRLGLLDGFESTKASPRNVDWRDESASLEDRAGAYLDINCGHCHNPDGAADTSALYLDNPELEYEGGNSGVCKPPVAAGQGTGGHRFDIVPGQAEQSILWYRMNSINAAVMMPELGRSTIDDAGVALIAQWINAMDGVCE